MTVISLYLRTRLGKLAKKLNFDYLSVVTFRSEHRLKFILIFFHPFLLINLIYEVGVFPNLAFALVNKQNRRTEVLISLQNKYIIFDIVPL